LTKATLSSNLITLAAGKWSYEIRVPGYRIGNFRARLYNVTSSSIQCVGSGSTAINNSSSGHEQRSIIRGEMTLSSTTVFRVEIWGSIANTSTLAQGFYIGISGTPEKYAEANFTLLE
jgi:hypothetical protein